MMHCRDTCIHYIDVSISYIINVAYHVAVISRHSSMDIMCNLQYITHIYILLYILLHNEITVFYSILTKYFSCCISRINMLILVNQLLQCHYTVN
jgi:hypothetical protein